MNLSPTCCMLTTDNTEFHLYLPIQRCYLPVMLCVLSKHIALEGKRIPIWTMEKQMGGARIFEKWAGKSPISESSNQVDFSNCNLTFKVIK